MQQAVDCVLQAVNWAACGALLPPPAHGATPQPADARDLQRRGSLDDGGAATRALPRLLELARQREGWEEGGKHKNSTLCRTRTLGDSPFAMIVGQRHIRASAGRLAELAAGVNTMPPLDPDVVSARALRAATATAEGVYTSEVRLPWPLSNRQVVWTEAVDVSVDGGTTAAVCMVSTTHAEQGAPPGTVLGELLLGGFVFEPDGDGCLCSFLCHFDPKGSIPAAAANIAIAEHVAVLDVLAEAAML